MPSTLAHIYDADFGQRTDDLERWRQIVAERAANLGQPIIVTEGGVGTGRVLRSVATDHVKRWNGMDPDPDVLALARARAPHPGGLRLGRMEDPGAWDAGNLAIIAYSTFYLVPHDMQPVVVQNAMQACGCLVVECFVPRFEQGFRTDVECIAPLEGEERWQRQTTYNVGEGVTAARRRYGPVVPARNGTRQWKHEIEETIFWRTGQGLASLLAAHGTVTDLTPPGNIRAAWLMVEERKG